MTKKEAGVSVHRGELCKKVVGGRWTPKFYHNHALHIVATTLPTQMWDTFYFFLTATIFAVF